MKLNYYKLAPLALAIGLISGCDAKRIPLRRAAQR